MKAQPLTFRIYPDGAFLYVVVNIWPTKKAMYAHGTTVHNYEATCGGRSVFRFSGERWRKTGMFAELNFTRRALGVEIVSHEFTHAGFCWAERRKLNLNDAIDGREFVEGGDTMQLSPDGVEERFCYVVGRMCNRFTQRCYELGLYREIVQVKPKPSSSWRRRCERQRPSTYKPGLALRGRCQKPT